MTKAVDLTKIRVILRHMTAPISIAALDLNALSRNEIEFLIDIKEEYAYKMSEMRKGRGKDRTAQRLAAEQAPEIKTLKGRLAEIDG
jgi:hypothetical protein